MTLTTLGFLILGSILTPGVTSPSPEGITTNHIILLSHPAGGGGSSFFGFSHLFLPGSKGTPPAIIIGAPRGSDEDGGPTQPGVVWKCILGPRNETCRRVQFPNSNGTTLKAGELCSQKRCEWRDGSWLGMTLAGDAQRLVACAPKWQRTLRGGNPRMNGLCHLVSPEGKSGRRLIPLGEPANQIVDKFPVYSWAQAGFSATLDKDGGIIMGAPGVNAWNGTVVKLEDGHGAGKDGLTILDTKMLQLFYHIEYFGYSVTTGEYFEEGIRWTASGAPRGSSLMGLVMIFQFPVDSDDLWFPEQILEGDSFGSYFGFAVASGDLNGDGLEELLVGAPFRANPDAAEVPALFSGDEGCVFVYSAKGRGGSFGRPEILCGVEPGGHFGSAIAVLGDINQDGFQDLGVGAPHEHNGEGAVYIYRGTATFGVSSRKRQSPGTSYAQKIRPSKDAGLALRGFGASISGGVDLDGNGTPDVGIGAFQSESLMILRTRRVVRLENEIQLLVNGTFLEEVPEDTDDLTLRTCTRIGRSPLPDTTAVPRNYEVNVEVTFDPFGNRFNIVDSVDNQISSLRIGKGWNTLQFQIQVNSSSTVCTEWNLIRMNKSTNELQVPEISVHWNLEFAKGIYIFPGIREYILLTGDKLQITGENFDSFCSECPAELEMVGVVTFPLTPASCDPGVFSCTPEFALRLFFVGENSSPAPDTWRLGSESLSLILELENTGLIPGSPLLTLSWTPDWICFADIDPFCTVAAPAPPSSIKTLHCTVGILGRNQTERIRLSLEPFYARTPTTLIQVSASLQSPPPAAAANRNQSPAADKTKVAAILLKADDADVELTGSVNRIWIDGKLRKVEFFQTFQMTLLGENRVEADYNFWFPAALDATPLLSLFHPPGRGCEVKGDNWMVPGHITTEERRLLSCANPQVTCLQVACKSRRLEPGDAERLSFRFSLDADSFRSIMEDAGKPALEIASTAEVRMLGDKVHQAVAITTVEDSSVHVLEPPPQEGPDTFPVYVSGILVGCLLLILLCLVLQCCGFFDRNGRAELLQRQADALHWTYSQIYQQPAKL